MNYNNLLTCPYCPRVFTSPNIRRMHLETFHADESLQTPRQMASFERSERGWLAFLDRMRTPKRSLGQADALGERSSHRQVTK